MYRFFSFSFDLSHLMVLLNGSPGTRLLFVFSTLLFDLPIVYTPIVLLSLFRNITLFSLDYIGGYSVAAAMNCAVETNDVSFPFS